MLIAGLAMTLGVAAQVGLDRPCPPLKAVGRCGRCFPGRAGGRLEGRSVPDQAAGADGRCFICKTAARGAARPMRVSPVSPDDLHQPDLLGRPAIPLPLLRRTGSRCIFPMRDESWWRAGWVARVSTGACGSCYRGGAGTTDLRACGSAAGRCASGAGITTTAGACDASGSCRRCPESLCGPFSTRPDRRGSGGGGRAEAFLSDGTVSGLLRHLEGEKRYDVDIGDDEPIELVLRDILGELSERGHTMKGPQHRRPESDLGRSRRAGARSVADAARTRRAAERGAPRPGRDLRRGAASRSAGAIGSTRSGRCSSVWPRPTRTRSKWSDARRRRSTEDVPGPAARQPWRRVSAGQIRSTRDQTHSLRLCFPRFYPDVPIDCYIDEPFFHPNVRPETGFVCLWEQADPRDTVIQALARTQAMAAYRMVNTGAAHLMNREAAEWYQTFAVPHELVPLTWDELRVYEVRQGQMIWLEPARQLSQGPRARPSMRCPDGDA